MVIKMKCLFCDIINNNINSYIIYENDYIKCFLDINPNNVGHTLIVPKKHIKDALEINNKTLTEINNGLKIIVDLLNKKFKPDGYKFVVNYGICQEIKHYHLHIIPKYKNEPIIKDLKEVYNTLIK